MKVGFIGLGNMGRPMALNLLKAGFEVTVHNRTRSKSEELAARGARVAASPALLARECDVALACLADVAATREVFLGEGGLAAAAGPGKLLVDHSTVDLETSREVHRAALRRCASFLDAPVSGGPGGAAEGTLTILVGGGAAAFERARPVLEAMGKTVLLMGGPGAGTASKLSNQLLVGVNCLAACEALALARAAGVDLEKLAFALSRSWGQSRMLERTAPRVMGGDFGPSAAPLRNIVKDLSIIAALAAKQGLVLPAAGEALRAASALLSEGMGDRDLSALALLYRDGRRGG